MAGKEGVTALSTYMNIQRKLVTVCEKILLVSMVSLGMQRYHVAHNLKYCFFC